MDLKTITATLAVLGTGISLSACKTTQADATEVPASKADGGGEGSCGAKGDGSCGA